MGARDFDNTPPDVEATEPDVASAFAQAIQLMPSPTAEGNRVAAAMLAVGIMIANAIYSLEATIIRGRQ